MVGGNQICRLPVYQMVSVGKEIEKKFKYITYAKPLTSSKVYSKARM
jgi:hypothetical protein